MPDDLSAIRYDVVVDPTEQTSHGKLVRYTGRDKRVLDLGCATGGVARALAAWGCTVWGVEIDADAAKLAEPDCERVVVGDLDATDLTTEFAGQEFDVVLAGDVLEHVMDPARVLRQARALLASGGYVVLSVPNMAHGSVRLALLHGELPASDTGLLDHTHVQYLTRSSLTRLIEGAGFSLALLDSTIAPIRASEVPFPDDAMTKAVMADLERDPDASIYQYVAVAFPGETGALPPLAAALWSTSEDLNSSRLNASQWEERCLLVEARRDELERELAALEGNIALRVSAGLAPLRQQLLVTSDQLMHRDHDVKRVVDLYEQHTQALRDSEEDRRRLHMEIVRSHAESAALAAERDAMRNTRTWRFGQKAAELLGGKLSRPSA